MGLDFSSFQQIKSEIYTEIEPKMVWFRFVGNCSVFFDLWDQNSFEVDNTSVQKSEHVHVSYMDEHIKKENLQSVKTLIGRWI